MVDKITKEKEEIKFKGRYINVSGKRKTSTAQIRMYRTGTGTITVNGEKGSDYFTDSQYNTLIQPLKLSGLTKDVDFSIVIKGGGKVGQSEAVRHGITNALIKLNPELRPSLKAKGWVTRDARKKERKKPGLKKARRAPQWAKR